MPPDAKVTSVTPASVYTNALSAHMTRSADIQPALTTISACTLSADRSSPLLPPPPLYGVSSVSSLLPAPTPGPRLVVDDRCFWPSSAGRPDRDISVWLSTDRLRCCWCCCWNGSCSCSASNASSATVTLAGRSDSLAPLGGSSMYRQSTASPTPGRPQIANAARHPNAAPSAPPMLKPMAAPTGIAR